MVEAWAGRRITTFCLRDFMGGGLMDQKTRIFGGRSESEVDGIAEHLTPLSQPFHAESTTPLPPGSGNGQRRVWFRTLGPIEIVGPQGTLRLRSSRERTILALLVLDANSMVSVDRLVDSIWGETPPATARNQIHIRVSNLRRAMSGNGLEERIVTRAPGYLLRLDPTESDLHTFQQETAAGLPGPRRREVAVGSRPPPSQ